jgi:hypothetical protein
MTSLVYSRASILLLRNKDYHIGRELRRRLWFFRILCPDCPTRNTQRPPRSIPVRISSRPSEASRYASFSQQQLPRLLRPVSRVARHSLRPQHSLSFGLLNTRSLNNKVCDIVNIHRELSIDLLLLVETWHDEDSACINRLRNLGFCVAERSRPRRPDQDPFSTNHGGVAVVSNSNVPLSVLSFAARPTTFEFICVRISVKSSSSVIVLVYRTGPISNIFFDELSHLLTEVMTLSESVTVAGDFNIHVERTDDPHAIKLLGLLGCYGMSCRVNRATHECGGFLDLVFTPDDVQKPCLSFHETGLSDHCLVRWNSLLPKLPLIYTSSSYRPWKKLNLENFKVALLDSPLCDFLSWSVFDVDDLAALYDRTITQILDALIPLKVSRRPVRLTDPWFDEDCRVAKRCSRRLERFYRSLAVIQSVDSSAVLTAWRQSLRSYRALLRCKRTHYWRTKIEVERHKPVELWRSFNALLGRGRSSPPSDTSAENFHHFFVSKTASVQRSTSDASAPCFSAAPPDCELSDFHHITYSELRSALCKLSNKFSSCDPIPTSILKNCSELLIPFLLKLFNKCLSEGRFPRGWKLTRLRPILKNRFSDPHDLSSYRPIAMLPVLSKLLERLVASQLWAHIDKFNLLSPFQSAYRRHHSTETALLKVLSDLHASMDQGQVSLLTSLDLSSAFDSVDHRVLIQRLRTSFGLSSVVLDWFSSFLCSRSMSVMCNSFSSSFTQSNDCGVPQGSVLGPILFLLYTHDVISIVNRFDLQVHIFADDVLIYGSASFAAASDLSVKVSSCIDVVNAWFRSSHLLLNPSKTKVMWSYSSRSKKTVPLTPVRVCNTLILPSSSIKYLGFIIDSHLTFVQNISLTVSSCFAALRSIRSVRQSLSTSATRALVSSLVLSRLDYCISCHYGVPESSLKRLASVLHAGARLVMKSRRFDHVSPLLDRLNWLPIQGRIERRIGRLMFLCMSGRGPNYIAGSFREHSSVPALSRLRSSKTRTLVRPATRRAFGDRSFFVYGPKMWNSLPCEIRDAHSFTSFYKLFNDYISRKYFVNGP